MQGAHPRLAYMAGLDGIRALAVIAVVLFHSEFGWASGGFIGVSVFFTLSGYLITSLLLAEHQAEGRVALRGFYARRARRLLPASLLCMLVVLAAYPWWSNAQLDRLPGDALAALTELANWRFAFAGTSYRDLFERAPSPLAHFWSLSIEEQCYLIVPAVVVLCLRSGRRRLQIVLASLTVASVVAMLSTSDFDLAYNGTHTRAAELLIGALAATVFERQRERDRGSLSGRWLQGAGIASLSALAAAVVFVSINDRWLLRGGFVALSVLSVVAIRAASRGPVGSALSWAPLVGIGRISYGIYLFHWPVFLVMNPQRTGFTGPGLFAARIAVVLALAVMSSRLVEQPIRTGHRLRRPVVAASTLGAASAAVAVLALGVVPTPTKSATEALLDKGAAGVIDFAPAGGGEPMTAGAAVISGAPLDAVPVVGTATTLPPPAPTRVLFVGSAPVSTAGLAPDQFAITDSIDPACPVTTGVETRLADGSVVPIAGCAPPAESWPSLIDRSRPDVIVVSLGPLDSGIVRQVDQVGFPEPTDLRAFGDRIATAGRDLAAALAVADRAARTVVVVDRGVSDWFREQVDATMLELDAAQVAAPAQVAAVLRALRESVEVPSATTVPTQQAVRLLVIGDSTSLLVARALNDASDGRLVLRWAGAEGCPFVRTVATRAQASLEWGPTTCESFASRLPPLIAEFEPDALLLVEGAMELVEQQYPGDPAGHLPGSVAYTTVHDAEMERFLDVLAPFRLPLLVADAPPLVVGAFVTPEMAEPSRLTAWNDQIRRWDERFDAIEVFPYAQALVDYEALHGLIRSDGSHPELEPLTEIARASLVEPLLDAVRRTATRNSDLFSQD